MAAIDDLNAAVAAVQARVTDLRGQVTTLTQDLAAAQAASAGAVDPAAVEAAAQALQAAVA